MDDPVLLVAQPRNSRISTILVSKRYLYIQNIRNHSNEISRIMTVMNVNKPKCKECHQNVTLLLIRIIGARQEVTDGIKSVGTQLNGLAWE